MKDKEKKKEAENRGSDNPTVVVPSHTVCWSPAAEDCKLDHRVALSLAMDEYKEKEIKDPRYHKAIDLYNNGRLNEAKETMEEFLSDDPEVVSAHLILGDIYERQNKYTEAIREYDHVLKLIPGDESTKFKRDVAVKQRARDLDRPVTTRPF